jgi:hypothetical protein
VSSLGARDRSGVIHSLSAVVYCKYIYIYILQIRLKNNFLAACEMEEPMACRVANQITAFAIVYSATLDLLIEIFPALQRINR